MAPGSQRIRVDSGMGVVWFIGWIFTIGYVKLGFWPAVLALIIWPYHLGVALR
ncbi:MAG: hypothetical protein IBX62_08720 [Coriobacteriia bacterium]|nr:hypothetical protein [Coriobacteriia bacterium]